VKSNLCLRSYIFTSVDYITNTRVKVKAKKKLLSLRPIKDKKAFLKSFAKQILKLAALFALITACRLFFSFKIFQKNEAIIRPLRA
jgi:hypothetical protein